MHCYMHTNTFPPRGFDGGAAHVISRDSPSDAGGLRGDTPAAQ